MRHERQQFRNLCNLCKLLQLLFLFSMDSDAGKSPENQKQFFHAITLLCTALPRAMVSLELW